MDIKFFHRKNNKIESEKVYGSALIQFLYGTFIGRIISIILAYPLISMAYGRLQNSKKSAQKIPAFIDQFDIDMSEFDVENSESGHLPYSTFNNFFIREFKAGKRSFIENSEIMPAFCEARYFGFPEVEETIKVPVKGKHLTSSQIIDNNEWNETFKNGPMLIARLCPVDYHRFHFPDKGEIIANYFKGGNLHSVNPLALTKRSNIFATNYREITILKTENFGKLAYIEVGAMCVGKIIQNHDYLNFVRGQEKGFFLFGGSTVIVMGESGKWIPSTDILTNSSNNMETYVQLGDHVAIKLD